MNLRDVGHLYIHSRTYTNSMFDILMIYLTTLDIEVFFFQIDQLQKKM